MTTAETTSGVRPALAEVPAAELRVAVIGVGMMGADHVARLHSRISGAKVVAVSDAFAEKADQVAAAVPGCRVITDPLAAIADPGVDAVLIASPGRFPQDQVLAGVVGGVRGVCESPLGGDAAG
jgi:myo-inositol 2-dehydrogenase/D-chiro-inositol 1-dehydrogenase